MSMRATVNIERYGKSGRRLERRRFPSRSFTLGLLQLLYVQHSQLDLSGSVNHIRFAYTGDGWWNLDPHYWNLMLASPGGHGVIDYGCQPTGDEIGIQVGAGSTPVDARDRALDRRIASIEGRNQRTLKFLGSGHIYDLADDGTYLYYVDVVSAPSQIYKVNRFTGEEVTHFAAPGTSYSYNRGLAHDGVNLWVTGYDSGKSPVYRIYKISDVDGTVIDDYGAPNSDDANGLAFDGTYLWVAQNINPARIHQCSTADMSIISTITPPYASDGAYKGLAWDGTNLWGVSGRGVKQYSPSMICRFSPADGSLSKEVMPPGYGYASQYYFNWGLTWLEGFLWLGVYCSNNSYDHLTQLCAVKIRFDYGGCEVVDDESYINPNGSFTVRRYFTNKSGGAIAVSEVGLWAMRKVIQVARDLVSPAVNVLNDETLKVEYTFQITV